MNLNRLIVLIILNACLCFVAKAEVEDERRRAFIKDFITYYQMAYQKKELTFIAQFFSNDALIVTETKQLISIGSEVVPNSTKTRQFHSVIENKSEYIARLQECFDNNDNIAVGISNVLIRNHPKYPEIYGVNFFQIWEDTGTMNVLENKMPGYVFMMIDFRDNEMEPIVHVRTWQPKSNIEKPSDKYSLTDFRILTAE